SLATASVMDHYKRYMKTDGDDAHYLRAAKGATALWGGFACIVALYAANLGALIDVVNRFGSFFYGSLLGVFILAVGFRRATSNGAFVVPIGGIAWVAAVATFTSIAYLWHNVVGAVVVVTIGLIISLLQAPSSSATPSRA